MDANNAARVRRVEGETEEAEFKQVVELEGPRGVTGQVRQERGGR